MDDNTPPPAPPGYEFHERWTDADGVEHFSYMDVTGMADLQRAMGIEPTPLVLDHHLHGADESPERSTARLARARRRMQRRNRRTE